VENAKLPKRELTRRGFLATSAGAGAGLALAGYGAPYAWGEGRKGGRYINPLYGGADPYVIRERGFYYRTASDGNNKLYVTKARSMVDRGEVDLVRTFPEGRWNSAMLWGRSPSSSGRTAATASSTAPPRTWGTSRTPTRRTAWACCGPTRTTSWAPTPTSA
jgi:hypothetical protein